MTGSTISLRLPSLSVELSLDVDLSTSDGQLAMATASNAVAHLLRVSAPFLSMSSVSPTPTPGGTVEGPVAATVPARSAGGGATPSVESVPKVIEKPAKRSGPKPGRVTPQRHRVLSLVADAGGMFEGSTQDLLDEAGDAAGPNQGSRRSLLYGLEAAGLVSVERPSPRKSTAVRLTSAGWSMLGRRPSAHPGATQGLLNEPTASKPPVTHPQPPDDAPKAADLVVGPIERRPFDPDSVRAGSVNGAFG